MSIAEGDQLANEPSQDNRLRFADALCANHSNRVDFSLGSKPGAFYLPDAAPEESRPQQTCATRRRTRRGGRQRPTPRTELTKKLWE
jgi:hypothetical protein